MWLAHRLAPASPEHNVWLCLDVVGELDVNALRAAMAALAARHEILRTVYREAAGVPVQEARPAAEIPVERHLVEGGDVAAARRRAVALAAELAARPFDLAALPLLRAYLVGYGRDRRLLLLVMHHIVVDEWSTGIFAGDLRRFYAAARRGEAADVLPRPPRYADYAVWERTAGVAEAELDDWTERLAGLEPLDLGLGGPEAEPGAPAAGALPFLLPADLATALDELARGAGATRFMLLLALFQVTLSRWCGSSDIGVGIPFAGREDQRWAETLGFFANTLLIRTAMRRDWSFRDLLTAVRGSVLEAFEHRAVPFDAVAERLQRRHGAGGRLPQVLLGFTEGSHDASRWTLDGARSVELVELPLRSAKAELTLSVDWAPEKVRCVLRYPRRRGATQTATALADALLSTARACVQRPDSRPGSHPLCGAGSRRRIVSLTAGEAAERPAAAGLTALDLFRRSVRRDPGGRAIEATDGALTFAELDERSDRLAAALRRRGVGPETVVAVCVPRQTALPVSMLAVWKAAGAFLLLDATQPEDHLLSLLRDAGVGVLLAWSGLASRVQRAAPVLLRYDDPRAWGAAAAGAAAAPRPRNLAYLIYTSGSTGSPKGVLIEHGNLVAHALTRQAALWARVGGARPLRVAASAAVTFDIFIDQFMLMAALGQCLVLLGDDERLDPDLLLRRAASPAAAGGVDYLHLVPSQLEQLAGDGLLRRAHRPRVIRFGGEAAGRSLWDALRAASGTRACHAYGLTECTIWSTWAFVDREPAPTIGRGAGDARVYVVDADLQLLPPGAVGEICMGGNGVGRGYLGHPGATAARFVPDPFSQVPGARMYRTGDLARVRLNGRLQFLGRADDQLKIRGHRIEPAEVEAALQRAGARQAAVVGGEQPGRAAQLVAFVVPADGVATAADIRAAATSQLASHLVPDRIVCVPELPHGSSGKVDRRALTRLASAAPKARPHVTPRTDLERQLCSLWSELLGVDRVGPGDDFFQLGGHSLLAVRLAALIRERLGLEVPVQAVLGSVTVEALARELGGSRPARARARGHLVELRPGTASGHASSNRVGVFVHPLGGTVLCYRQLIDHLPDGPALYGVESLPGMEGGCRNLRELAGGYADEIAARLGGRSVTVVGWSAGGIIAYEVAQRLLASGTGVALAALETHPPTPPGARADLEPLRGALSRLRDELRAVGTAALHRRPARRLLRGLGVRPRDFAAVDCAQREGLLDGWERLLRLLGEHRLRPASVPTWVVLATGNAASSVEGTISAWEGLVGTPIIELVAGDHRGILRSPAVAETARSLGRALGTATDPPVLLRW